MMVRKNNPAAPGTSRRATKVIWGGRAALTAALTLAVSAVAPIAVQARRRPR